MAVVAASNSRKGSFLAGAAMAIGLVPSLTSAPNGGTASAPAAVYDHVLFGRDHRVVADSPGVAGVEDRDYPDPHPARLVHGHPHQPRPEDGDQPVVGIDGGSPRRLPYGADIRPRIEAAARVLLDVVPEHVGHAVRLDAPEVAGYQCIGALDGFLVRDADPLEQGRYRF